MQLGFGVGSTTVWVGTTGNIYESYNMTYTDLGSRAQAACIHGRTYSQAWDWPHATQGLLCQGWPWD
jgi:hypothetical protein